MQQAGTGDISMRMDALRVDNPEYADGGEKKQQMQEALQGSIGPEERRRLTVAAMSPEDIVLCVDICPEMGGEWAGAGPGGGATSRMRVVQAALSGFVRRKCTFNPRHRFAVVVLGDGVQVMRSMTPDIRSVMEAIERLQPNSPPEGPSEEENPFDFSELLACIAERFPPPSPSSASLTAGRAPGGVSGAGAIVEVRPVVRALVVFGRSHTCPIVPAAGTIPLLKHERFFLDCVYLHRKPSREGDICQKAFDLLVEMESRGGGNHSYFLECGHSLLRFNSFMASLLAHPVQRDYQEAFFDKLAKSGEATTTATPAYRGSPSRATHPIQTSGSANSSVASSGLGGGSGSSNLDGGQ